MAHAELATRKAHIIAAAALVFAQKGLSNTRMDDIVAASGLSKGTLYWYFKSKDELIMALFDHVMHQEIAHLHAMLAHEHVPAHERLLRMTRAFLDDTCHIEALLPLAYEFYARAARDHAVRPLVREHFARFHALLEPFFAQAIADGEFRPLDPATAVCTYLALFEGLVLTWSVGLRDDGTKLDTMAYAAVQLFVEGLRPTESRLADDTA